MIPPFHTPVFVLTNHARPPIVMDGGTTFHFVAHGIYAALERAKEAANGADVRLGGGVATIRQYLLARLVDEMHVPIAPVILGSGESLLRASTCRNLSSATRLYRRKTRRTLL